MVKTEFSEKFKEKFFKIKDKSFHQRIIKLLEKIKSFPELGKPMRHERAGTRELYVGSYRLAYAYFKSENRIILLDIYHKDFQ